MDTTITPIKLTHGNWARIHNREGSTAVELFMVNMLADDDHRLIVEIVWKGDPDHTWQYRIHQSDWESVVAECFPLFSVGKLANAVKREALRATKIDNHESAWGEYAEATVG